MATAEKLPEHELVARRNQTTQAKFANRRKWSIVVAVVAFGICIVLFFAGRWALSVSSLFLSMIALSSYFTANGHLHHVQKRGETRRKLSRDFSILDRDDSQSTPTSAKNRTSKNAT